MSFDLDTGAPTAVEVRSATTLVPYAPRYGGGGCGNLTPMAARIIGVATVARRQTRGLSRLSAAAGSRRMRPPPPTAAHPIDRGGPTPPG